MTRSEPRLHLALYGTEGERDRGGEIQRFQMKHLLVLTAERRCLHCCFHCHREEDSSPRAPQTILGLTPHVYCAREEHLAWPLAAPESGCAFAPPLLPGYRCNNV